jgi:hypothetical protein
MTSEIRELKMPNGKPIFVEVEISDKEISPKPSGRPKDLPAGAEAVGILDDALNSMKLFQENITNMAETVYDSLKDLKPEEWSLEMNIGFQGEVNPVPFIATGKMNGGIKVTAKWKKGS